MAEPRTRAATTAGRKGIHHAGPQELAPDWQTAVADEMEASGRHGLTPRTEVIGGHRELLMSTAASLDEGVAMPSASETLARLPKPLSGTFSGSPAAFEPAAVTASADGATPAPVGRKLPTPPLAAEPAELPRRPHDPSLLTRLFGLAEFLVGATFLIGETVFLVAREQLFPGTQKP